MIPQIPSFEYQNFKDTVRLGAASVHLLLKASPLCLGYWHSLCLLPLSRHDSTAFSADYPLALASYASSINTLPGG